ncbi:MAG: cytosine permease [Lentisphaeria bacterium]
MAQDYDYSTTAVDQKSKRGFWSMFVIMMGFTFFSASMWAGASLGVGLTLKDFIIAVFLGNLILGAYTGILAYMASSTGLGLALLSRHAFGRKGSYLPSFLLAITQIGWFGVGIAMFALPVQKLLQDHGCNLNIWIIIIIAGILMTSSAYWGIKALAIVSLVAVPAIAVFGCFSVCKVFADNAGAWSTLTSFTPGSAKMMTMTTALAVTIGSFISGGTCTPDFVRFAKTKKIAVSTVVLAFFLGNSLMFTFGAIGGMFYQTNDISDLLVMQGLLIPGVIVLGLNIWTTNDNALYTSGLSFANIFGWPKKYLVLINGAIGTILALWLNNNFVSYLVFLNTIIPPIGAVMAVDFFAHRKSYAIADIKNHKFKTVSWPAVIAWACGCIVAFNKSWGVPAINGMAVAGAVYFVIKKIDRMYFSVKNTERIVKKIEKTLVKK